MIQMLKQRNALSRLLIIACFFGHSLAFGQASKFENYSSSHLCEKLLFDEIAPTERSIMQGVIAARGVDCNVLAPIIANRLQSSNKASESFQSQQTDSQKDTFKGQAISSASESNGLDDQKLISARQELEMQRGSSKYDAYSVEAQKQRNKRLIDLGRDLSSGEVDITGKRKPKTIKCEHFENSSICREQ